MNDESLPLNMDETCRACLSQNKQTLRPIAEIQILYTNCTKLQVNRPLALVLVLSLIHFSLISLRFHHPMVCHRIFAMNAFTNAVPGKRFNSNVNNRRKRSSNSWVGKMCQRIGDVSERKCQCPMTAKIQKLVNAIPYQSTTMKIPKRVTHPMWYNLKRTLTVRNAIKNFDVPTVWPHIYECIQAESQKYAPNATKNSTICELCDAIA